MKGRTLFSYDGLRHQLTQRHVKALASATRREGDVKGTPPGKEEIKLYFSADGAIAYFHEPLGRYEKNTVEWEARSPQFPGPSAGGACFLVLISESGRVAA